MRGLFFFALLTATLSGFGQPDSTLKRYWYLETNLGYVGERTDFSSFYEFNVDVFPSYAILPRLQIGPRFRWVSFLEGTPSVDWQHFFLAGINVRWDALVFDPARQHSVFLEAGFYRGDFCSCYAQAYYYRRGGLWYGSLGIGGRWFPLERQQDIGLMVGVLFHTVSHEGFNWAVYNFGYLGITARLAP